jgi:Tol biopolymer transport system component
MFSPDNQSIIFSSPVGIKVYSPNWFDKLLGVQVALANGSLPSDWWSIPMSGGTPRQLTHLQSQSLFGTISPDNKYIASYSPNGIFVMKPDGTEITIVVNDVGGIPGTVDWIP